MFAQAFYQRSARIKFRMSLHANKNMSGAIGVIAVIKLGDLTLTYRFAELLKTARFFRDGHSDNGFALFTQFRPLGNVT